MPRPPIIPRDTLVEYQPWEPTDFERQAKQAAAEAAPPPPPPEAEPEEPPMSEEEWQAMLDAELATARDEGRRDGFAQGFQDGFEQGRRQGEEDSKQIAALMQSVRDAIDQLNGNVADELVDLALQLAQQFLRGALHAQPERVLPLVREVLGDAPTAPAPAMLRVHADDAELIRQMLGAELAAAGWTIIVDAAIERGGCRVQTRFGETDATLQTRWAELTRALGRDTAWIASERAEAERVAGGALHVA
ncbi:flagellar assembly protein FliH [Ralstonia insidiosa]|jgi:flagellar assembly protein FliH|uniref:flagellar assembly protein FliH n=1 Tax=Ralstonia TaxID=48736 RepID=UPI000664B00B|nr:flagellar assembly protein FliH [Ralstonia insidiosa]KMW44647.1 flagellar assembly protein FliH [Ralstonia sp. MD27]MBX3775303.1 flagellar assembly protein FliH [Ralstonia pickettii]NOZ19307.1 flagellar assembly protein FliH [Betaproteobacteria bacterium]MBA9859376.1 flagellar assembly protein FliH [Ralstonia insidiosa]MBA9872824.1 flagellar assembly protein FliH [Ralstonia insidiosa]